MTELSTTPLAIGGKNHVSTATDSITTVDIHTTETDGKSPLMITVLAEPTQASGLVVTPEFRSGRMTGSWQLTHGVSGRALPVSSWGGISLDAARRIGDALSEVAVDWTVDLDALIAQLRNPDTKAEVADAVKKGKYPPTDGNWDGDGDKPVDGPGGYPNTWSQATARQLAGAYTAISLKRYADSWRLASFDVGDKAAARVFVQNASAMIAEYGLVHLLRAFGAVDQDAADYAARDFWEACQAGDSIGEWLSEWADEYGIAQEPDDTREIPGLVTPPALEYDAVLRTPLAYTDHGTIGSLREEIARTATRGQERFTELLAIGRDEPLTDAEAAESMIAHGCSYNGWALVGVLGWLAKHYPQIAVRAARMVDDIGTNGGNDYCDDIAVPATGPAIESAPSPE